MNENNTENGMEATITDKPTPKDTPLWDKATRQEAEVKAAVAPPATSTFRNKSKPADVPIETRLGEICARHGGKKA